MGDLYIPKRTISSMYNIVSYPHATVEQSWIKHLLDPFGTVSPLALGAIWSHFCVKQDKTKQLHPESPLNRSCSHIGSRWDGAENSGFTWFHLVLMSSIWSYVRSWFKKLYMWSCFAKISWSSKKSSQNFRWFKRFSFIPFRNLCQSRYVSQVLVRWIITVQKRRSAVAEALTGPCTMTCQLQPASYWWINR
jgi:hypothetical protein